MPVNNEIIYSLPFIKENVLLCILMSKITDLFDITIKTLTTI